MDQPAPEDFICGNSQIRFCFSSTGGKPDQVNYFPRAAFGVVHGLHGEQLKGQLERTPFKREAKIILGFRPDFVTTAPDFGELAVRRPVERGYIVNWEGEKAVWEHMFADLKVDAGETNLILTEQPGAPAALERWSDEMVFEEFGFAAYHRTVGLTYDSHLVV